MLYMYMCFRAVGCILSLQSAFRIDVFGLPANLFLYASQMHKFIQIIGVVHTCIILHILCRRLKQRQEAVSELTTNESPSVSLLRESILHLPDLERMLCSAYHKKVFWHYFDPWGYWGPVKMSYVLCTKAYYCIHKKIHIQGSM